MTTRSAKRVLVALCLLGAAVGPAAAESDCSLRETGQAIVTGDSKVEVRPDPAAAL